MTDVTPNNKQSWPGWKYVSGNGRTGNIKELEGTSVFIGRDLKPYI